MTSRYMLFPLVIIGFMTNNLIPARIGELVRAYLLGEREGTSKAAALGTIAVDRLFDGLTLVLMLANAIALVPPLFFIFLETKGSQAATDPVLRELIAGFWIMMWPIGVLGSLAVAPGGLVLMSWQAVRALKGGENRRGAWLLLTAALLTSLHAALLLLLMFEYAPKG